MTSVRSDMSEFRLAGYLSAFDEGFAIPCYITQPGGNVWYTATCSVEGDHDGAIIGFEVFESDDVQHLPEEQCIEVCEGDTWQDVYLRNGKPYVGRPQDILEEVSPELKEMATEAPISLLDLALSAGDTNPRPLVRGAFEHVTQRHGKEVAANWFRETLVREQGQLLTRRHLAATGNQKLSGEVRRINVQEVSGRLRLILPETITAALERMGQAAELVDRVESLADQMTEDIDVRLADEPSSTADVRRTPPPHTEGVESERPRLINRLLHRFGLSLQTREEVTAAKTHAEMARRMRDLARTDVVTGLLNRAGLNNDMLEMLMVLPKGQKMAMFWLDIDRFKEINDTLGHPVGDKVLAAVANRLRAVAPEGTTIARFGGDEFILVAKVVDRRESERLAQGVIDEISRPTRIDGHRIDTAASMGVALLPDDGPDIETLMQGADLALYHAKIGGKSQVCFFDSSMTRELIRRREIEAELRAAIQHDELQVFFQPIVDLETGRIRTFEALLRWFHPTKGEIPPADFIPVAEDTGVIVTLGHWVVAQSARSAAKWPDDVAVSVNLSPVEIRAPGAALGILAALREAGLDPHRLELEVTESLFLDDDANTARFMEDLTAQGVSFTLDDFGTGYSSLGYINKFPFKKIKVDRSFVSGPNIGKRGDAVIRAVAEMGATLDMEIVAEGLETIEQVQVVRNAGCTLGQGFYFSKAVPDHVAAMLLSQERSNRAHQGTPRTRVGPVKMPRDSST